MTAAFGRRRSQTSAPPPKPKPEVVLTLEQRAYLFGEGTAADAEMWTPEAARADGAALKHRRSAGLLACGVATAVTFALTLVDRGGATLAGMPPALDEMSQSFIGLIGPWGGPFVMVWSIVVIAGNLGFNLWATRRLTDLAGWRGLPVYMVVGGAISLAVAFISSTIGLGASDIGYPMELASGAGAAGLYRLLLGRAAV